MHGPDETISQSCEILIVLIRPCDDLVIDISDVTHVRNIVTERFQKAENDIKDDHDPGMTEMAEVIDRHATNIHAHLAGLNGYEFLFLAAQVVMDSQHLWLT